MPDPVRPSTPQELAAAVAAAAAAGHAVSPRGGGTQTHLGFPPTRPAVTIDTRGLSRLIDHPARDLTVTAEAGMTVAALRAVLAGERQRLPVDVPAADRATLGGSVAANVSGPRRLGCGTLRDYLLGLTVATAAGELASAGGRVVKNVAGYDLMKLHTGALGTLGVITQVTFKVTPVPETRALVAAAACAADVAAFLDTLHASAARPPVAELWSRAFVERLNRAAGAGLPTDRPWLVVCGFEEKAATVDWQVATLLAELPAAVGLPGDAIWDRLADLAELADPQFTVQVSVPPSRLAQAVTAAGGRFPELVVHAHALTGVFAAHWPAGVELTADRAAAVVAGLLPPEPGNLAVTRCPAGWGPALGGRPRPDSAALRAVKRALDPDDVFNPGRLFG